MSNPRLACMCSSQFRVCREDVFASELTFYAVYYVSLNDLLYSLISQLFMSLFIDL